ncbi:hypothetical protein CE91St43_03510 [Oscillospiraceae bacterium]|nr:hypothetical protein CE91St43_03510 [Oscillospiraceae bacterium]
MMPSGGMGVRPIAPSPILRDSSVNKTGNSLGKISILSLPFEIRKGGLSAPLTIFCHSAEIM